VIPPPAQPEPARDPGDSWLTRVMRAVFGWKPNSMRADLETVLAERKRRVDREAGFLARRSARMLKNILALAAGAGSTTSWLPRADIISGAAGPFRSAS